MTLWLSLTKGTGVEITVCYQEGLSRKDGPFIKNLDDTLASFNVVRQAYYIVTFVGNHVHRTLKV